MSHMISRAISNMIITIQFLALILFASFAYADGMSSQGTSNYAQACYGMLLTTGNQLQIVLNSLSRNIKQMVEGQAVSIPTLDLSPIMLSDDNSSYVGVKSYNPNDLSIAIQFSLKNTSVPCSVLRSAIWIAYPYVQNGGVNYYYNSTLNAFVNGSQTLSTTTTENIAYTYSFVVMTYNSPVQQPENPGNYANPNQSFFTLGSLISYSSLSSAMKEVFCDPNSSSCNP